MKKFSAILFALISISLLSACGDDTPPSLEDRVGDAQDQIQIVKSYTGTIEAFGVDIYQDGTHKIVTDDNQTVVIQSPTINLNNFVGKKVTVTGSMQKLIDNKGEVFTVGKIELQNAAGTGETTEYNNQKFGFQFSYPSVWELNEESSGITFRSTGIDWVKIEVISNVESGLDEYVKTKEVEDGTPVTIGAQRSLRYIDGKEIRIYVPNDSKKKIYKITFLNNESADTEANKTLFYSFLETFTPLVSKTVEGEKCGGTENVLCAEGFRCELNSGDEDAEGICVSVTEADINPDCPYVPVPAGCVNYEAKSFNNNKCPTSYTCLDKPDEGKPVVPDAKTVTPETAAPDTTPDTSAKPDTSASAASNSEVTAVISAFSSNKDTLPANAATQRYEVVVEQSIIAVNYTVDEKKYRAVYEYAPSGSGYSFTKKSGYEEGTDRDWVIKDGEEIKINFDRKIVNADDTSVTPQVVLKDMRLYENSYKSFSLQFPNSWYYRSFGGIDDSIWTVGFGPKSINTVSDSAVTVEILEGAGTPKKELSSDKYTAVVARDEDSHFFIEGPLTMKDMIDKMADTIAITQ